MRSGASFPRDCANPPGLVGPFQTLRFSNRERETMTDPNTNPPPETTPPSTTDTNTQPAPPAQQQQQQRPPVQVNNAPDLSGLVDAVRGIPEAVTRAVQEILPQQSGTQGAGPSTTDTTGQAAQQQQQQQTGGQTAPPATTPPDKPKTGNRFSDWWFGA